MPCHVLPDTTVTPRRQLQGREAQPDGVKDRCLGQVQLETGQWNGCTCGTAPQLLSASVPEPSHRMWPCAYSFSTSSGCTAHHTTPATTACPCHHLTQTTPHSFNTSQDRQPSTPHLCHPGPESNTILYFVVLTRTSRLSGPYVADAAIPSTLGSITHPVSVAERPVCMCVWCVFRSTLLKSKLA